MKNNCLGKKIKELRIEQKISQRELSENLGFSNQTISFWETGQREPDMDTLVKIAKYFNVSADYLLGLTD
ncbi:MAG: helix-turn-helix domain-containing protein [Clostridia bacterium]|nr:helix-turn-helix domain-containing protein [Clostridia bacterium]